MIACLIIKMYFSVFNICLYIMIRIDFSCEFDFELKLGYFLHDFLFGSKFVSIMQIDKIGFMIIGYS